MELTTEEISRYNRHLILSEIGEAGQLKLKKAKVLVIGCGGLGAPLLQYLAAAGVGTIGIVDFDIVEDSNLQRQILFTQEDVGKAKVEVAKNRLQSQNPNIKINIYKTSFTSENAIEIATNYDIIADGTDNFPTRYLVNDVAVLLGVPNVYASILKFEGQLSVFNYQDKDGGAGPNYRDLFPNPPDPKTVSSCAEAGVLGVLPGMLGSMQANEVIKIVCGIGEVLSGRLFIFDSLKFESRILNIAQNPDNEKVTHLIDYHDFCGWKDAEKEVRSIDKATLDNWRDSEDIQLIDVREESEYKISNLNALLIPQNQIENRLNEISKDKKVVIHCQSGKRSEAVIALLQDEYGYTNLYNLDGGIEACAKLSL